ncbi:MAG: bifunctional glutamate N-acetyltransferase/amino-acid acetyltransferase ArgJ [Candidatus Omnitrophica bacterium]|nr:bifunctional glutamate N-acetyltransferase/amino-acid acetyltransferase ArgJ [Candidatus Omnitrophota bacterium]
MKKRLPEGFLAAGIHCGLKKKRKDLALFFSEKTCKTVAFFTTNAVKAAPVILGMEQLGRRDELRAVVVNSGNANCMTGAGGMDDARKMAARMQDLLDTPEDSVLVSSTGIIGKRLDRGTVLAGMKKLVGDLSADGLEDAAEGIVTTDKFTKISVRTFKAGGRSVTITGVAKGAGMIHPDMATTLCYVMTDAAISRPAMRAAFRESTDLTFNSITVDGDMSTNDTMLLMANGAAGNRIINKSGRDYNAFRKNLRMVCSDLARMVVLDGEGASRFVEVRIKNAVSDEEARKAAKSVAGSLLVKCAVLGGDPNWGRIASSIGASRVSCDPAKMVIKLDGKVFFSKGCPVRQVDRKKSGVFKGKDVLIEVSMGMGNGEATVYTCDISKKYLTLNSFYTT